MSQSSATLSGRVDEMISAAVRGLIAQRKDKPAEVAMAAGMSRAALYRKLSNDSPWQADEVDRLARFFEVSRDSLYEGRAEFRSSTAASLFRAGTRSSTDRASDYGSERGHSWSPFRQPERRRRMGVIPLRLVTEASGQVSA